ncbi:hypothetical protein VMCG_10898 [Cytospora schulzeri]|uniref:Uncharacterized protein n=1 Tax=Cytospora schulzeri TaxID=448051 RepID=A0A423V7R9_9PEZI|nr:hypothetical protein VMCG_10898 [Valsa malicola]
MVVRTDNELHKLSVVQNIMQYHMPISKPHILACVLRINDILAEASLSFIVWLDIGEQFSQKCGTVYDAGQAPIFGLGVCLSDQSTLIWALTKLEANAQLRNSASTSETLRRRGADKIKSRKGVLSDSDSCAAFFECSS